MAYDKINEPENVYLELNGMSTTASSSYVYMNFFSMKFFLIYNKKYVFNLKKIKF